MLPLSRDRRKKPAAVAPKAPRRAEKTRAKRPKTEGATQHEVDLEPDSPVIREHKKAEARRRGFKYAAWLVILIVVGTVGWAVIKETFVENPKFGLREVIVNTRGALTPRKIVRVLGLTEGCSVLTLNMHHLAEKLRRLPEVKDARIAKDNDGRLIINVTQRDPIAWIESSALKLTPMKSGFGCLVDAEGIAIPCEVILDEYASLPVIQNHSL
ncbi:MAG: FtsQ-type POTRA domain-containing protein, partial [Verrucomicrobiales bacterium]|nr:FtsQ-type POTRA domain-containing protein [Verrucomicrobiales bacterium]